MATQWMMKLSYLVNNTQSQSQEARKMDNQECSNRLHEDLLPWGCHGSIWPASFAQGSFNLKEWPQISFGVTCLVLISTKAVEWSSLRMLAVFEETTLTTRITSKEHKLSVSGLNFYLSFYSLCWGCCYVTPRSYPKSLQIFRLVQPIDTSLLKLVFLISHQLITESFSHAHTCTTRWKWLLLQSLEFKIIQSHCYLLIRPQGLSDLLRVFSGSKEALLLSATTPRGGCS